MEKRRQPLSLSILTILGFLGLLGLGYQSLQLTVLEDPNHTFIYLESEVTGKDRDHIISLIHSEINNEIFVVATNHLGVN